MDPLTGLATSDTQAGLSAPTDEGDGDWARGQVEGAPYAVGYDTTDVQVKLFMGAAGGNSE